MPSYVGIRWLKVNVLPTPERLSRIVSLAPFLDASYSSIGVPRSTVAELVEAYADFLDGKPGLFMFDLAHGLDELVRATCNDGIKQYIERSTPLVHLDQGEFFFYPPDTFSASCAGTRAFLRFSFPAAFSPTPFTHTLVSDTLPNRRLYEAIRSDILCGSKPVIVVGPTREWRLPLRVDPAMRSWLAAHPVLAGNGLRLK